MLSILLPTGLVGFSYYIFILVLSFLVRFSYYRTVTDRSIGGT